jgi:catechol 2,3-dioxygenase-like lactoylglutathione lyase family enzyme
MTREKAHVSINVSDLKRAVGFYRTFLGIEPARLEKDYAKFELERPPLVLSLEPIYHRAADSFNHLGLRLDGPGEVAAVQARLAEAGVIAEREDDVECCYSRQTKFWLADPDKNLWEVYALTGELPHLGSLAASDALAARDRVGRQPVLWDHKLGDEITLPLAFADGSLDEVRLRGSFNTPRPTEDCVALLAEVRRVLAPGGQVLIHGLAADRPLEGGFPRLPGPAALVRHTPIEHEPVEWLARAGFVAIYVQRLGELPNFEHAGVKMRELMVVAWKPAAPEVAALVVYKGPFRSVTDDGGRVYPRGARVAVDAETAALLRLGPLADQFTFLRDRSRR